MHLGLHSLDSTEAPDRRVSEEYPEHMDVGSVVGQVIELGSDLLQLRQARPRHTRKVVVLDVIADIQVEIVARAVVAVGLLGSGAMATQRKHIVLGEEMSGAGVESHSNERAADEVEEGPARPVHENKNIESDDHGRIGQSPFGDRLRFGEYGTEAILQGLAQDKQHLPPSTVVDQKRLEQRRNIGIDTIDTLLLMVVVVVGFECNCAGHPGRHVAENGEPHVEIVIFEAEVVSDFVDTQLQAVVNCSRNYVNCQEQLQAIRGRSPCQPNVQLNGDESQRKWKSEDLRSKQLLNLRILLQHLLPSNCMGFSGRCPIKVKLEWAFRCFHELSICVDFNFG